MHFSLELVPTEVQTIAAKITAITQKIKADLQSNTAIDATAVVDAYYPEVGALRSELISLCDATIKTCTTIQSYDWAGVTARLQRLVTDSTSILHGQKHTLSTYLCWCETVISDIINK